MRLHHSRRPALLASVAIVALGVGALGWWLTTRDARNATASTEQAAQTPRTTPVAPRSRPTLHVLSAPAGVLDAPVQDAAAAALPADGLLLLGGLTAADTSTAAVVAVGTSGSRRIGTLPFAVHDAGGAHLGSKAYVFGGGDEVRQHDEIVRVDPTTGAAAVVGRLPAPSSDQAAATIGRTAYIVGGYTGTRWLDTIVTWKPGSAARVVGHLPTALRYAAVTAVAGRLIIAGGSRSDGTASSSVLEYVPATRRVVRIGRLPAPSRTRLRRRSEMSHT